MNYKSEFTWQKMLTPIIKFDIMNCCGARIVWILSLFHQSQRPMLLSDEVLKSLTSDRKPKTNNVGFRPDAHLKCFKTPTSTKDSSSSNDSGSQSQYS
jgi:hypothetical protein